MAVHKHLKSTQFFIPTSFCFYNFPQKSNLWVVFALVLRLSLAMTLAMDLVQMVLEVRKHLKPTQFSIPNSFSFYNYAQKSIPWVVLALVLLLAVFGAWTSPRWPWLSGKS